jgi:ribosomal protein S18 acetylase RimI-like enzyme
VKFFDERVSPFAGFDEGYTVGFNELHDLLPPSRNILYAVPRDIEAPKGWQLLHGIPGLQFVYEGGAVTTPAHFALVPLGEDHIEQMVALAGLTRPGPFGTRTIDFGHYYGIFDGDRLVAMTGQRLHVHGYTEISAVCTHPEHLGKGYAAALVQHALHIILQQDQTPFLHVRADNHRAIQLYERLGFVLRRNMNFYVLKRG